MQKVKRVLLYLIILGIPVMKIVNLFDKFEFNVALADVFTPIFFLVLLIDYMQFSFSYNLRYWWYFLGLVVITALSSILAYMNPSIGTKGIFASVAEIVKFLISASYFFVGLNASNISNNEKKVIRIWIFVSWIVIITGLFIQFNYFLGNDINLNNAIQERSRFLGTITDANKAASYLTITSLLSIYMFFMDENMRGRTLYIVTAITSAFCVILTISRSGILGLLSAFLLLAIMNYRKILKIKVLIYILLIISVVLLIRDIDYTFFNDSLSTNINNRINPDIAQDEQVGVRSSLWVTAWEMGKDNLLLGVGRGNYVENSQKYAELLGGRVQHYPNTVAHNTLLGFFAELGIIGLLWFMILPLLMIKKIWKYKNTLIRSILFSIYLAVFIQSMFINIENFRGLWFLIGLSMSTNSDLMKTHNDKYESSGKRNNKIVVIGLICILLLLYIDVGRKITSDLLVAEESFLKEIQVVKGQKYRLHYYVETSNNYSGTLPTITILNESNNIIVQKSYYKAKGYGSIEFDTGISNKIYVQIDSGDRMQYITIRDMYMISDDHMIPINRHPYLPVIVEKLFSNMSLIDVRDFKHKYNTVNHDGIEFSFDRLSLTTYNMNLQLNDDFDNLDGLILNIDMVSDNINNIYSSNKYNVISSAFKVGNHNSSYRVYVPIGKVTANVKIMDGNRVLYSKKFNINNLIDNINAPVIKDGYLNINASDLSILSGYDVSSSGYLSMYRNGIIETYPIKMEKGEYIITVTCYGTSFSGKYPHILIENNQGYLGDFTVDDKDEQYKLKYSNTSDSIQSFYMIFDNDDYSPGLGDINLFIKEITIEHIQE